MSRDIPVTVIGKCMNIFYIRISKASRRQLDGFPVKQQIDMKSYIPLQNYFPENHLSSTFVL